MLKTSYLPVLKSDIIKQHVLFFNNYIPSSTTDVNIDSIVKVLKRFYSKNKKMIYLFDYSTSNDNIISYMDSIKIKTNTDIILVLNQSIDIDTSISYIINNGYINYIDGIMVMYDSSLSIDYNYYINSIANSGKIPYLNVNSLDISAVTNISLSNFTNYIYSFTSIPSEDELYSYSFDYDKSNIIVYGFNNSNTYTINADGVLTTFDISLGQKIITNMVIINFTIVDSTTSVSSSYTAYDDGFGNIIDPSGICSGTVDYEIGSISLSFTSAPSSASVTYYVFDDQTASTTLEYIRGYSKGISIEPYDSTFSMYNTIPKYDYIKVVSQYIG